MRREIWKFELLPGRNVIEMPKDAEPLYVDRQGDSAYVWCSVDPAASKIHHGFVVVGTGHAFEFDGHYIGSWQFREQGLVFHAFDMYENPNG